MFLSRRALRRLALFLLADTITSIVLPGVSYALTTGPNQVEFTSYEPSNTTDMVNLLTGDFTYNVPLLDVPGPEGGFSLPLSYHSGVGLEDEASWAGLGWNVNAGSISRSKVSGADDDFDAVSNINVKDPGGSGYVKNYVLYQRSWDSEKGFGGALNLLDLAGVNWSDQHGLEGGMVVGLNFNKDKAYLDPAQAMSAATTILSFGMSSVATKPLEQAGRAQDVITKSMIKQANWVATGIGALQTAQSLYAGYKSQGTTTSYVGNWSMSKTSSNMGFRQDYKYWLDNNREEHSYGSLWLGQMKNNTTVNPQNRTDYELIPRIGAPQQYKVASRFPQAVYRDAGTPSLTSDMYTYVEPNATWAYSFNPTHVAYDSYSVMGPGVGGRIAPFRPEIGSLIFPKKLNNGSEKVNLVPFLEEGSGKGIDKVQFKYEGEPANTYGHHDSNGAGISISHTGTDPNSRRVYYNISDTKLTSASNRTEADREGLYNKRLAQGKHVAWFTNEELATDVPSTSGQLMEYKPLADNLRRAYRSSWPPHGIGGYAITNAGGVTYHYALPVYNQQQEEFVGTTGKEDTKFSRMTTSAPYATTWLLTAITGPDFVDRGDIGSVDAQDWGYWVKFDYGRFANYYPWRQPYAGYLKHDGQSSYTKGVRETYYLNSIQTRSHTALFLKDIRQDGRSAYRLTSGNSVPTWADPTDVRYPASSLALREIVLLRNADFQSLQQQGFTKSSTTGAGIDQNQLRAPASAQQTETCSLRDVYDVYDVQDNTVFRTFLNQKAQRRILLNTTYELCPATTNSFASASNPPPLDASPYANNRTGRLTLKSVSYYGPNDVRLFPDFKFQYNGSNPAYDPDNWDGWGSYHASGTYSHYAAGSDPAAWHLTDIVSPLGGRLRVKYEADDYGTVSGEPVRQRIPISGFQSTDDTHARLTFDLRNVAPYGLSDFISNGSYITLKDVVAKQTRRCWAINGYLNPEENDYAIPAGQTVQNLGYNYFTIQRPALDGGHGNSITGCPASTWSKMTGDLEVVLPRKPGGGVRVAAITAFDEANNDYSTGYVYTQSGEAGGASSGVVAQEPELVRTVDYPFYHYYDFPNTPVIYGKVTVVDGLKSTGSYQQKTQYNFNTPTANSVQITANSVLDDNLNWPYYGSSVQNSKLFYFDVKNYSASVGSLEGIRIFDPQGVVVKDTKLTYTNQLPGNQGRYTSGSILCEAASGTNPGDNFFFKLSRTAVTSYPNVLSSVQTVDNGVRSQQTNTAWDFLTGGVLQTVNTTSQGDTYATTTVPAYTKYPELRSKAEQPTNRHMLSQPTAAYTYKRTTSGTNAALVSAEVQTWRKDWQNYRAYNAATGSYGPEAGTAGVWRQHKLYHWNDPHPTTAGLTSINRFTDFNWSGSTQHLNWRERQEVTLYDHYSQPLEVRSDAGVQYASRKRGYDQTRPLLDAPAARYGECTYSGAEDLVALSGATHFGGEVAGGQYRSADVAHTGQYSLKLSAGQKGFVYETPVGAPTGLTPGRPYKASVWVHQNDLATASGQLYATVRDVAGNVTSLGSITIAHPSVQRAGNWYLLNLFFNGPASGQTVQVGCASSNSTVYFDDFRVHPAASHATSYVYSPTTEQNTHILNADNLYTRFEYNNTGQLYRVYREVLGRAEPEVLVRETTHNYARNTRYNLTTPPAANGTVAPTGNSTVYLSDDLTVTATGVSCNYRPSYEFQLDGITYYGQATLADGTSVRFNGADSYQVSNVHGNHTLQVKFDEQGYLPAGTWYGGSCIADINGCYIGATQWYEADGCGGYSNSEQRPAQRGECINQRPCMAVAE